MLLNPFTAKIIIQNKLCPGQLLIVNKEFTFLWLILRHLLIHVTQEERSYFTRSLQHFTECWQAVSLGEGIMTVYTR